MILSMRRDAKLAQNLLLLVLLFLRIRLFLNILVLDHHFTWHWNNVYSWLPVWLGIYNKSSNVVYLDFKCCNSDWVNILFNCIISTAQRHFCSCFIKWLFFKTFFIWTCLWKYMHKMAPMPKYLKEHQLYFLCSWVTCSNTIWWIGLGWPPGMNRTISHSPFSARLEEKKIKACRSR